MKQLVFPLLKLRLQNGESAQFWNDNWSPFGDLTIYLSGSRSRLGIAINATVASLCTNGVWTLPPARSERQAALYAFLTTVELQNNQDYYEWEVNGSTTNDFRTGELYHYLIEPHPDVSWAETIWFSRAIPRHSFHSWLVILDRIPTRDRLMQWGLQVDGHCLLCNTNQESRDHIYFSCNFGFDLWTLVTSRLQLTPHRNWPDTIRQMTTLPPPTAQRTFTLLAWQSTVYWIWNERNARLHASSLRSADQLFKVIDSQLRNKIQSIRESNPTRCSQMMQSWLRLS